MAEVETHVCEYCNKELKADGNFYRLSTFRKGKKLHEEDFCSLKCLKDWSDDRQNDPHYKHDIEQEIQEVVSEKREIVEETEKEVKKEENIEEAKKDIYSQDKKPLSEDTYLKNDKAEYIENKEFYLRKKEDIKKVNKTILEYKKNLEPSKSRYDDSDFYSFDPTTLRIKVRKMPRTVLDYFKQNGIFLDYINK